MRARNGRRGEGKNLKQILCWLPAALRGQTLLLTPPAARPVLGAGGNVKQGCILQLPKGPLYQQDPSDSTRKRNSPFLSLGLKQQKCPALWTPRGRDPRCHFEALHQRPAAAARLFFKLPADTELSHSEQFFAACVYGGWTHLNTSVGCRWGGCFAELQETLGAWPHAQKEQRFQGLLQNSTHDNKQFSLFFPELHESPSILRTRLPCKS